MNLTDIKDPALLRRIRLADQTQNAAQLNGDKPQGPTPGKRIKQEQKPLLNKLETAWFGYLMVLYPGVKVHQQAKKFRLGNGIFYKPDFTATINGKENAWEVKGPHAFRGGFENLKVAATQFPEVDWWLVWKEAGQWRIQRVLP